MRARLGHLLLPLITLPLVGCDEGGLVAPAAEVDTAALTVAGLLDDDAGLAFGRVQLREDAGEGLVGASGDALRETREDINGRVGGAPWFAAGPKHVAAEVDGRILVRAEGDTVRLVLGFAPEEAHDVALYPLHGGATFDGAPGDEGEGVHLPAGRAVAITGVDDDEGTLRVAVDAYNLQAEAWVAADEVGKVYDPAPGDSAWGARWPEVAVRSGVDVLDAPGGAVLATLGDDGDHWLSSCALDRSEEVDRWNGWTRVRVAMSSVEVDGWVPSEDAASIRGGCWGCGGVGWSRSGSGPANLLTGTELLDGPDGAVVGVVLQDHRRTLGATDEDGWAPVEVDTRWGIATVWVDALEIDDPLDTLLAVGI